MELAWAYKEGIPVVAAMEPAGNPHQHGMILEAIDFKVETLDEAIDIALAILAPPALFFRRRRGRARVQGRRAVSDEDDRGNRTPGRRVFESGATRDTDAGKPDYEGFLSPLVIEAFGRYMSKNRLMKDGSIRDSDNWQKGIPLPAYAKSGWRHFMEWWKLHRGYEAGVNVEEAICGLLFNSMGYLHEHLKAQATPQAPAA